MKIILPLWLILILFINILLSGCGSDDSTVIIVSEFPAEGAEQEQGSGSGASIIYTNKNDEALTD